MRKNKTVAYMLAAALLVGGTFAGTKALFQDTETVHNPLIIKTGKVDITAYGNSWIMMNESGVILEDGSNVDNTFSNVQPGYKFTKNIRISNNSSSTYNVNLGVKASDNIPTDLKNIITITNQDMSQKVLSPGGSTTMTVEVKINNTDEAWQKLNGLSQLDLDAIYEITGIQN